VSSEGGSRQVLSEIAIKIFVPVTAVMGFISAVGQFAGPYAHSGLQSFVYSSLLAVGVGAVLLVVALLVMRRRRVALPRHLIVMALASLLIAGAIGGTVRSFLSGTDLAVDITSPAQGEVVKHCTTVTGWVRHLPDDRVLWLVVQAPSEGTGEREEFYIMRELTPNGGNWSASNFSVGGVKDAGRTYWIQVYSIDRVRSRDKLEGNDLTEQKQTGKQLQEFGFSALLKEKQVIRGEDNATSPGGHCM